MSFRPAVPPRSHTIISPMCYQRRYDIRVSSTHTFYIILNLTPKECACKTFPLTRGCRTSSDVLQFCRDNKNRATCTTTWIYSCHKHVYSVCPFNRSLCDNYGHLVTHELYSTCGYNILWCSVKGVQRTWEGMGNYDYTA